MTESVVIFDGCTHFAESADYELGDGEEIVFSGTFDECADQADMLNDYV